MTDIILGLIIVIVILIMALAGAISFAIMFSKNSSSWLFNAFILADKCDTLMQIVAKETSDSEEGQRIYRAVKEEYTNKDKWRNEVVDKI